MEQSEFDLLINKNGSKNLGWKIDRLKYDSKDIENSLSEHWQKENIKRGGINYGQGILQDLFFETIGNPLNILSREVCHLKITNRDRLISATVIQWLGTNCGFCFLKESLSKAGYDIVKRDTHNKK